jgi:undecaprenyl diphosphate synthase
MKYPNHIAIIMDGNGRWGKLNKKNRIAGYQYGINNIKPIVNFFIRKNIKNLTLFALSADNLKKRKKNEIQNIFLLLKKYIKENEDFFLKNKILLNFFGEKKGLPKEILDIIYDKRTNIKLKKKKLTLNIAFNYSSKKEFGKKLNLYFGKNNMMGGCNELRIHSYIDNFNVFISFFCKASGPLTIEI